VKTPRERIIAVANARVPGYRAHSIQSVQNAAALNRCGAEIELVVPQRSGTRRRTPTSAELERFYGVRQPPPVRRIWSLDLIDRLPPPMQRPAFLIQAATFARGVGRYLETARWSWLYLRDPHTLYLLTRSRPGWLEHTTYEAHGLPRSLANRRRLAPLVRDLGRVIVLNAHLEEEYRRLGVESHRLTVEPAAAVGDGSTVPDQARAREHLELPGDRPLVCYAGSLTAAKGVDTLIRAVQLLDERWIVLLIGGDRRQQHWARLRVGSDSRIHLVGRVDPGKVKCYLAAADVLVLPNSATDVAASRWTSPMKLFESASVGRPIVLSDVPALRMAAASLPSESQVYWCSPDDPASLAESIRGAARTTSPSSAAAAVDDGWRVRAERILSSLPPGRAT